MNNSYSKAGRVQSWLETASQALVNREFQEAERAVVNGLHRDPFNAQLWVYLGEALLHQGNGLAARSVFERAWLLDPQASWVQAALKAAGQTGKGSMPPHIDRLLQVRKVSVAAAVLTRDEARCIERCLRSINGAVDEIVVIDSASTDQTLEIVSSFPHVKVVHNTDIADDFAALRNVGLSHIESDWVLWIDADEWLEPEDKGAVREAAGLFHDAETAAVLQICQVNRVGRAVSEEYTLPRLFQLGRGLHYRGRVHEQVAMEGEPFYGAGLQHVSVRIRLHHDGYKQEILHRKDKVQRNLRLLRLMAEEEPDNPGWLFFLGRETLGTGDLDTARGLLLQAEKAASSTPGFVRMLDIYRHLIKIHVSQNDWDEAKRICERALSLQPDYPDALFWLGNIQLRQAAEQLQQAEKHLRRSKQGFRTYRGSVSADRDILEWKADAALADLAVLAGKRGQAADLYASILKKHPDIEMVKKRWRQLQQKDTEGLSHES